MKMVSGEGVSLYFAVVPRFNVHLKWWMVEVLYIVDGGPSIRDGYPSSEREGRNQIIIFRRRRRRRWWWTTMESIALSGIYSGWKEGGRDCLSVND